MPPVFKALASISAWFLFINGLIWPVTNVVYMAISGQMASIEVPPWQAYLPAMMGFACLILAVCAMKLRQMLE